MPSGGPDDRLSSGLLTLQDVADFLQVSTRTVRRLVDRGELTAFRIGRSIRVRREDLRRLVERE